VTTYTAMPRERHSGANREVENTDAPVRGGLLRSSIEAGVMLAEQRELAIAFGSGQPATGRSLIIQWKAAAFMRWHEPDESRGSPRAARG